MLCGYRPFEGETAVDVFRNSQKGKFKFTGKFWTRVSGDAKQLISKMLQVNQKNRITAKKALDHPWFGLITDIKIKSSLEEEQKIDDTILERLESYKSVHKLKKALLNVLVKMLKPKETKEISEMFNRLDKDKTGYINTEELANSLKISANKKSYHDAKEIVKELDFAGNQKINYSEFLSA